ncbi:fungal-specific transcription factor domain-containing protein [Rhizoctonia solani]|nr:fungal-specific transcription factor domain-containing protein [Rhizoctonia solani]
MASSIRNSHFRRSRNGCLTCKAKRKKCDENLPICSRCSKVDADCIWPWSHQISGPRIELSFNNPEVTNKDFRAPAGSAEITLNPTVSKSDYACSSARPRAHMGTHSGSPDITQVWNALGGSASLVNYNDPNSIFVLDGCRLVDARTLVTSPKLWEYSQEYGPKVIWPPTTDERDSFDPEGIMPLVQRSISMLRITDEPVFQDVRDFFANFLTRFYYDYAAIHEHLHVRIRRRFEASSTLKQAMLGMAALFRSNYGQSIVPASMRNYAKELHQIASHTLQLELENDCISPWVKLAGLWELMNYEYFDGNLSSYYPHLNQAASIVRLATGSNNIDILKLSGEQTFDLRCFAWCDILSSMALSRPTLLSYESDIHNPPQHSDFADPDKGVEWIFGCPDVLTILLARTSALRHTRISSDEKMVRGREIQQLMQDWRFQPVLAQSSALRVARLAAQEIWRHAAILYVHQSIFKSNPSHPVVKNSVKNIIQTASTLARGMNPDCFVAVPYFIVRFPDLAHDQLTTVHNRRHHSQ